MKTLILLLALVASMVNAQTFTTNYHVSVSKDGVVKIMQEEMFYTVNDYVVLFADYTTNFKLAVAHHVEATYHYSDDGVESKIYEGVEAVTEVVTEGGKLGYIRVENELGVMFSVQDKELAWTIFRNELNRQE